MRRSTKVVLSLLGLFCLIVLGGVALLLWEADRFLNTPANQALHQGERFYYITIEPGSTFDQVAEQIAAEGGVSDALRFKLYARWQGVGSRIKAGDYEFRNDWNPRQVMQQLVEGKPLLHRITIPEGLPWWQVADMLEEGGFAKATDFAACVKDINLLRRYGIPMDSAEGFLFPDTYLLSKPRTPTKHHAAAIMHTMVKNFWKRTAPVWAEAEQASALMPAAPTAADASIDESANAADAVAAAILAEAGVSSEPQTQDSSASQDAADKPKTDTATLADGAAQSDVTGGLLTSGTAASGEGKTVAYSTNVADSGDMPAEAAQGDSAVVISSSRQIIADFVPQFAKDHPDEVKKIAVMASLVEKESGIPDERPRIAGVLTNRLRANMPLQCDPTVIYGLGKDFSGPLLHQHLTDARNPYNTYRIFGLPPGPICSPGLDAMKAAFKPEPNGYYYFVATGKSDGRHIFSKNLKDHNNAVQLYRRAVQNAQ